MSSKSKIEHQLRVRAVQHHEVIVISLLAYRKNKEEQERLKKQGRMLDALRTMSGGLGAQLTFKTNFEEMDRCFNTLYEMGAIPAIRFPWQTEGV